jgi:glucose/mannose-6-phosphate isomerase
VTPARSPRGDRAGRGPLATLLSLVTIGDFASCYVGLRAGVDPTPVEAIQGLKAALAAQDLG